MDIWLLTRRHKYSVVDNVANYLLCFVVTIKSKELIGINKKLGNESFLKKAPADIVDKVKEKHASLSKKQEKLTANLDRIKNLENR